MIAAILLLIALALPVGATPVPGAGATANAVAPNQSLNNQTSSGVVNQAPVGGVNNNIQQNSGASDPVGFGPGIQCPVPSLTLGAFGTGVGGNLVNPLGYGVAVALVLPLGGATTQACEDLGQEIAWQRRLDTAINLVKACSGFSRDQVTIDPTVFPELERCRGVSAPPKP